MALGSFTSKVLIDVKADTSDAKAKLKELSGEQKRMQQQLVESMEKSNASIDRQIKNIGLAAAGFGVAKLAIGAAKEGLEAFSKTSEQAKQQVDQLTGNLSRSFDEAKSSIGELVIAIGPLVTAMAKAASYAVQFATSLGGLRGKGGYNWNLSGMTGFDPAGNKFATTKDDDDGTNPHDWDYRFSQLDPEYQQAILDSRRGRPGDFRKWLQNPLGGVIEQEDKKEAQKRGRPNPQPEYSEIGGVVTYGGRRGSGLSSLGASAEYGSGDQGWDFLDMSKGIRDADKGRGQRSNLSQIFGTTEQMEAYMTAFNALSGAVTATMEAWVSGSESAGKAFKKFISQSLVAIATDHAIKALAETAEAIASLARYDYPGAATHGAAAAKHGVVSAAALVAAKALGGGGGGTSSYGGGGGSAPTATGGAYTGATSGGGGGRSVTVVYGDSFAEDSPRRRQLRAEKVVKTALGTTGVVNE